MFSTTVKATRAVSYTHLSCQRFSPESQQRSTNSWCKDVYKRQEVPFYYAIVKMPDNYFSR